MKTIETLVHKLPPDFIRVKKYYYLKSNCSRLQGLHCATRNDLKINFQILLILGGSAENNYLEVPMSKKPL